MKALVVASALLATPFALPQSATAEQVTSAQMDHAGHMDHTSQTATILTDRTPDEGGQAAFAAINEIVAMLDADPGTDWSKVNIEALRQHLIDMDNVAMRARAEVEDAAGGVRFRVTGAGGTVGSIRRMAMAHAATMNGTGGWTYSAEQIPGGAAVTVVVEDPADLTKLKALGFIGVMALGSHHQQHHLMLAGGMNPHH